MKNIRLSLKLKILIFILIPVITVFISLGLYVGLRNKKLAITNSKQLTEKTCAQLSAKAEAILNKYIIATTTLANALSGKSDSLSNANKDLLNGIVAKVNLTHQVSAWALWKSDFYKSEQNTSGWLLVESNTQGFSKEISTIPGFEKRFFPLLQNSRISISDPYQLNDKWYFNISAPIFYDGQIKGLAGFTLETNLLDELIDESGNIEGSFFTIVNNSSKFITHTNPAYIGHTFKENLPDEKLLYDVDQKIARGETFNLTTKFQRQEYYSIFTPIIVTDNVAPWCAEFTVPMHMVLKKAYRDIMKSVYIGIVGIIILIIVIWAIALKITKPIEQTTKTLELLAQGNTRDIGEVKIETHDELEEMFNSLNKVIKGNQKTEEFALHIGQGNLESEYQLLSNNDHLGQALISMRENLKLNKEKELIRIKEDEQRNWSIEGIAKFSEILRQDNDNLGKFGYRFLGHLIDYIAANQGSFFVLNIENEKDVYFELISTIAYDRNKLLNKKIGIGEGLVGRCAFERKTIYMTEVPNDYVNITSGLGTANPRNILIVPCIINEQVFAVIELASFNLFKTFEIEFVEKLGESIASTISNIRINEKTNLLLKDSQEQSEQMAAQEEEMRQNLEELQATQEDFQRQIEKNEEIRSRLTKETALLDALINNSFDLVYFKDLQSRFIRVTKSMLNLFGLDSFDQILGKTDFDFAVKEEAQRYYDDEQQIIKTGKAIINQIQKETRQDGSIQYTSTSKYPLYNSSGEIMGTFGFTKDVTEMMKFDQNS